MHDNREAWLLAAVDEMRPWFADFDKKVPDTVLVSVGYAKRSGKGIGWCYHPEVTEDNASTILISPEHMADDPVRLLGTLLHELIHAADGGVSKHRGWFALTAKNLGLTGKMTATTVGDELRPKLEEMAKALGEFPHKTLNLANAVKGGAQKNRQLKIECTEGCGYKLRGSRTILDLGVPNCPVCDVPMEEAL